MNYRTSFLACCLIASLFTACKKDEPETTVDATVLQREVLEHFSLHIAQATYNDLASKSTVMHQSIQTLIATTTDPNLGNCRQAWRDCRGAWEQSEAFLFGPVASENIDPRIDTWPVNYTDLDSVLQSNAVFTTGYIDSLEDALKGFHPIEYLLFGTNGTKTAAQFTSRELDFLNALSANLEDLTNDLAQRWNPNTANNYSWHVNTAGQAGSVYTTKLAAYEEIVQAMIGICEEVAGGKMGEPLQLQDPSLEESPFSQNSMTDFTNNIRGVKNVYLGNYSADGKGLEDLVRENNLSLDGRVKQKADQAIASLNAITVPFGQAIISQPIQVQNAINAINDLKNTLETDLLPFVQQQVQ